ncbi:hypothetical protein O6H91_09G026200 [Diphasiastrum complanatum]|uniref:Uncharacterized protein n=1 Tax=Diphasiastrum complanatum TaxID=34168 RepID=A0ACC2CM90_DIPCM|nr:hypothetical protein O6H91_09G026200 [Diphasiastrum complanatum]
MAKLLLACFLCLLLLWTVPSGFQTSSDATLLPTASGRHLLQGSIAPLVNPALQNAFIALQAWKNAITSDPLGITATWVGPNVCQYRGVFCSPPPDKSCQLVVSGIDLNHALLTGTLPEELGLLTYLALFHINTNFFSGPIPYSFKNLFLLFELDISNNRFSGDFPAVVLGLPSLAYLDIRFNGYRGILPPAIFDKQSLDAIFVNNNYFACYIPANLGNSPVSVVNFANNQFDGTIPGSIGNMFKTLNEINFLNNELSGCIPPQVGALTLLNVFDASFNLLGGTLPDTIANMISLVDLDVADNLLTGVVPAGICDLPNLVNFTFSDNFFTSESPDCLRLPSRGAIVDDRGNCIPNVPFQRPPQQCAAFLSQPTTCYPKYIAPDPYGSWAPIDRSPLPQSYPAPPPPVAPPPSYY